METTQTTQIKQATDLRAGDVIVHASGKLWLVLASMLTADGITALVINKSDRADGVRRCELDTVTAVTVAA